VCLFCNIAAGDAAADILYQDDEVVAFRDIRPQAPHHILVIPRRHVATLNDFEPEDARLAGRLILVAAQIARELGIEERGYRLVTNCNREAGQTVYHVHLHLLAGRPLRWPPG